jgi:hypothetical protein
MMVRGQQLLLVMEGKDVVVRLLVVLLQVPVGDRPLRPVLVGRGLQLVVLLLQLVVLQLRMLRLAHARMMLLLLLVTEMRLTVVLLI